MRRLHSQIFVFWGHCVPVLQPAAAGAGLRLPRGREKDEFGKPKNQLFKENQAQEPIFPNWNAVFQGTKRSAA